MKVFVTHHNWSGPIVFTFDNVDAASKWMQTLQRNRVDFSVTYERPETT